MDPTKPPLSMNGVVDYSCYEAVCSCDGPEAGLERQCLGTGFFKWMGPYVWVGASLIANGFCPKGASAREVAIVLRVLGIAHSLLSAIYAGYQKCKPEKATVGNHRYKDLEIYRSPDNDSKSRGTRNRLKVEKCCLDGQAYLSIVAIFVNAIALMAALEFSQKC